MLDPILNPLSRRRLAAILLLLFASFSAAAAASEQWYVVSIGGEPVGSLQETHTDEGASLRIESRMTMVLNRLGSRVEMATGVITRESTEGRLLSTGLDLKMSSQTTSTTAEVGDGVVRIRSQAGGQSFDRTAEFSGELLGPEGIRALSRSRLLNPGDSFTAQTFAAEMGASPP